MTRLLGKFSALESVTFVDPLVAPEELVGAEEHVRKRLQRLGSIYVDLCSSFTPSTFES